MQKTIYESRIGIWPFSDRFLRKAVLEYQLFLLLKKGIADNVSNVQVRVAIPDTDSKRDIDRKIIEWFEEKLLWRY